MWNYYQQLAEDRPPSGMDGPRRIPRSVVHEWEADEGIQLERWERRALRLIDSAWVDVQHKALAEQAKKPT